MTLKTSASYFSFRKTLQQETIDMLKTNQNFDPQLLIAVRIFINSAEKQFTLMWDIGF
jgi:hypothetical protein